jgi:hypothetical protein
MMRPLNFVLPCATGTIYISKIDVADPNQNFQNIPEPELEYFNPTFGVGSGSVSQRSGSADPDPYQNITDPQQ